MKSLFYKQFCLFFIMLICFCTHLSATNSRALVIVPVADVVYEPLGDYVQDVHAAYSELPYAEVSFAHEQEWCERGYQLLFNEIVNVLEERGEEVLVSVPHIFYKQCREGKPQTEYWLLRENIMLMSELLEKGITHGSIPQPIRVDMTDLEACNKNTVALRLPFYDTVTQKTYSAGTRFIYTAHTHDEYTVLLFDAAAQKLVSTSIPVERTIEYTEKSPSERVNDFVQLVRLWADMPQGIIPYVWGGASFTYLLAQDNFSTKRIIKRNGCARTIFVQNEMSSIPYTGFDCSCLISRAAQLCGLPYFLGNSATIEYTLPTLKASESIKEGDIIWFHGHVVVISNISENMIVEARGYGSGFGRIHEVKIGQLFKEIKTIEQLKKAYIAQTPVTILNKEGQERMVITQFKICKLSGIWPKNQEYLEDFIQHDTMIVEKV